ncbi:hypothetical protein [Dactylosporangium sp. CS-033363]|uniref:hypothetical protein n=1 Tax=Dactylosporangium sp. CS-033363 TaxID=3239935 RepID=UPI003D8B2C21
MHTLEAPVGGGYAILVSDFDEDTRYLSLRVPGADGSTTLGYVDSAHPMPHALRWSELDLVARAAAALDPALPHPGPLVAAAADFVIVTADTEIDAAAPPLTAALGSERAVRRWLYRADARERGVVWERTPDGDLVLAGAGVHTRRVPGSTFPFAGWRAALAAAEQTLGGPVALPDPAPSPLRAARRFKLNLTLHVPPREIVAALDAALRERELGSADGSGAMSTAAGVFTAWFVDVLVHDDLEAGRAVVRAVLDRHGQYETEPSLS